MVAFYVISAIILGGVSVLALFAGRAWGCFLVVDVGVMGGDVIDVGH